MKCTACGYEYKYEIQLKPTYEKKILAGDEEFIKLISTIFVESDNYYHTKYEVSLCACPKCKTVQLVDY